MGRGRLELSAHRFAHAANRYWEYGESAVVRKAKPPPSRGKIHPKAFRQTVQLETGVRLWRPESRTNLFPANRDRLANRLVLISVDRVSVEFPRARQVSFFGIVPQAGAVGKPFRRSCQRSR